MYLSVTLQTLKTIVTPVEGVDTKEDRVEAMRILAAGNSIIMLLLGAILCLQVSVRFIRLSLAIVAVLGHGASIAAARLASHVAQRTHRDVVSDRSRFLPHPFDDDDRAWYPAS